MAGQVLVDDRPAPKAGTMIDDSLALQLAERPRYVGRGGEKLEHALAAFALDVIGLAAADIGASTGGFTDCLLQHGAERVYAIDVGRGQLAYDLRNDPRVVVMEGVNARNLGRWLDCGAIQAAVRSGEGRGSARRRDSRPALALNLDRALRLLVYAQRLPYRGPCRLADNGRRR